MKQKHVKKMLSLLLALTLAGSILPTGSAVYAAEKDNDGKTTTVEEYAAGEDETSDDRVCEEKGNSQEEKDDQKEEDSEEVTQTQEQTEEQAEEQEQPETESLSLAPGQAVTTVEEFAEAIRDASYGETIPLAANIDVDLATTGTLMIERNIRIDCNGHTLSGGGATYAYNKWGGLFSVLEGCTLTLSNAQIQMKNSTYTNRNGSTRTELEDVIAENNGAVVVETSENGITAGNFVRKNSGVLNVQGGNFVMSDCFVSESEGSIEVTAGSFKTESTCFNKINGSLIIHDAEVNTQSNCIYVNWQGDVTVYGGKYTAPDDCVYNNGTFRIRTGTFEATADSDGCLYGNGDWIIEDGYGANPEDYLTSKPSKVVFRSLKIKLSFYSEGKIVAEQEALPAERVFPENPVHSKGYEFCFWEDENGNPVTDLAGLKTDTTLFAVFSDRTYTVSFTDKGTVTKAENVPVNTPLGKVAGLDRKEAGDSFMFWRLNDEIVDETSTLQVRSDLTLEAVYGSVVKSYEELKDALARKEKGIVLGADITVKDTIQVDYSCAVDGKGFGLIRPADFTGILLSVKDGVTGGETTSGVETDHTKLVAKNVRVDGKNVEADESAVVAEEDTTLVLTGVTVENNHGTECGGGIRLEGADAYLTDCVIQNNRSTDDGGGICAEGDRDGKILSMQGCKVLENYAEDDGGGLYQDGYIMTLKDCQIDSNTADGDGGGIHTAASWSGKYKLEIRNSQITNNKGNNGGGVVLERPFLHLYGNTVISRNTAERDGGGVFSSSGNSDDCILYMHDNSAISYNKAGEDGGGMCCDEIHLVMYDQSSIAHNYATEDGGGVYAASYGMEQNGGVIRDNEAGGNGGGVYVEYESTFTGGMMFDNIAAGMGDDLYHDRNLEKIYPTQAARTLGDGNSETLGTVSVKKISGDYPAPTEGIRVPWYGWYVDGEDNSHFEYDESGNRKWVTEIKDLYTGMENSKLVSEENGNLGILSGEVEDIGIKAIWYGLVLAYDANYEGSTEYQYDEQAYLPGTDAVVKDGLFTRPGYRFIGWNSEKNGSGTAYEKDAILTMDDSKVLYAQWEKVPSYKVTYVVDGDPNYGVPKGGEAPTDPEESYSDGTKVKILPGVTTEWTTSDGTKNGVRGTWKFSGWDKEDFEITEDTEIHGRWIFTPEDPKKEDGNKGNTPDRKEDDKGKNPDKKEDQSKNGKKSKSKGVKTGDENPFMLWGVLLGVSILGIGGVSVAHREKNKKK